MADRSFKEYVANHFYDELFAATKEYIDANSDKLDLYSIVVSNIDAAELSDIDVKMVGVEDQPEMRILFDVVVEAEIEVSETTRHYDDSDLVTQWFVIRCSGDLDKKLADFEILNIATYNQKSKHNRPLSDSLVPILYKDQVEEAATAFLRKNYPKVLQSPMALDVADLARVMGLTIKQRSITSDFSVFGQICFEACDIDVYDEETGTTVTEHFDAKTILVDPKAYITPDGKKRIYSSRYALSSIVFCGHCGDIYRRIKWNNRGCKSTVWRCVSRVLKKDSGIDCPARMLREEDLHAAALTAVNDAWSRKADIIPALKENIKAVLDGGVADAIAEIDEKIKEKQKELLEAGHDDALIDSIGAEIIDLREEYQDLMTTAAKQQELQERLEDLDNFLDEQTEAITKYSEALVRRLIEKIMVYDEKLVVEFKSGLQIEVEA